MFIVLSSWPKSLHHCVVSDHFFKGVSRCVHSFPFPLVMVPQRHISSIVSSSHHVASHSRPHHRTAPVCVRSVIFLCSFARHGAVIRLQHRRANACPRHLVHMSCETYSLLPRGGACCLSVYVCPLAYLKITWPWYLLYMLGLPAAVARSSSKQCNTLGHIYFRFRRWRHFPS